MTESDITAAVSRAAEEIERILNHLEVETGRTVRALELAVVETTSMASVRREHRRQVLIDMDQQLGRIGQGRMQVRPMAWPPAKP